MPASKSVAVSRKNCRCSGKNTEKRRRLTTCRSTSACAKSVLTVPSTMVAGEGCHSTSPPRSARSWPLPSVRDAVPVVYGRTANAVAGGGGSSPSIQPEKSMR